MRCFYPLILLVSLTILGGTAAWAHGGGGFRGPRGPTRAPSIRCDCACAACARCATPGLIDGEGLSVNETRFEVLRTWGELARVRITTTFETREKDAFLEGYTRVSPGPLLAVTAGFVRTGESVLVGTRRPSTQARRDYLWQRRNSLLDPLLVQRHAAGAVDVRAYPITPGVRTTVVLEGYVLLAGSAGTGVRVYRTGELCLVVAPLTGSTAKSAAFVDTEGGRALSILDVRTCRRFHPKAFEKATPVPCVPDFEAVMRGTGEAAVSSATALVALPPGRAAPTDLFIGDPKAAPWREPRSVGPPPPPQTAPGPPTPPGAPPPARSTG